MSDLDALAAEVRVVDLGDRVRRAHRRGVRRRFLIGGVTVLLVAVIAVVAVVETASQRVQPPAGKLDGTLVTARENDKRIVVESGGDELLRLPGDAVDLAVSPDRDRLAWRQSGRYFVAKLPGGEPKLIAEFDDACLAPAWAPDGAPLLLTAVGDGEIAWRDIESGDAVATLSTDRERSTPMCQVFPSASDGEGYDLYYGTGGGFEIRYLSPDGDFTDTGVMKGLRDHGGWTGLSGLSADGSLACVRASPGARRCDGLIDMDSRTLLRDLTAASAWFVPGGGLLTTGRAGELVLRDRDGSVVERAAAPADSVVLAYFPD